VSAQVVDVTDTGVNLNYQGALLLDVACPDSYRDRRAGDWVAIRPGTVPVVLWRIGPDPGGTDEDTIREVAEDAAADLQVVRAVTWGTSGPAGSGWQTTSTLYVRKNSQGKVELYAQLASVTDPSPPDPPARAPSPVTVSPTAAGTWRSGRPDEYASTPVQGGWTGRGNRRGGWFYGTAIQNACTGKTVASMTATFTRKTGSGVNAKRPLHLYLHGYSSPPPGQLDLGDGPDDRLSLSAGARGSISLPSAWRTALAAGGAGLAIYADGATDYMAVSGGSIRITFSP
jgi:hypothetical protein